MERGDISTHSPLSQATIWENVLATPPEGVVAKTKHKLAERNEKWEQAVNLWKPQDMPLRSLIDCVNRLQIGTDVITFLSQEAVEPIYRWLVRKGVSTSVWYYPTVEDYAFDLRYNRSVKTVYVSSQEEASIIGLRSHVVQPDTQWRV
jgi:hypothetical protein